MEIDKVKIVGFRNFRDSEIRFNGSTLVIGANDVGKTNLVYAIRLLLDKSLSDRDIEPDEKDFHINSSGIQDDEFSITITFKNIIEDAALSVLKGHVSDSEASVFTMNADRRTLGYQVLIGSSEGDMEVIPSRFYLKYINMRYVSSQRDLLKFINNEKKQLLRLSHNNLDTEEMESDELILSKISRGLDVINERVRRLNYVKASTALVNDELEKLSYNYQDYSVHLDSGSIKVHKFIDELELGASTSGSKLMLGGDGKNNQILLALWKAKSEREHDPEYEVTFYCVEEPEAHLHPHQQRKLADYLIKQLPGQTIITSHSPQITARYKPDSIVHIVNSGDGESRAASSGCSNCINAAWDGLGYRMSILPAESFFSACVFLVEGPSELIFYQELATKLGIDLDFYNISILSVNGIAFQVYISILDALEIPWVMRTDNDVSKVPKKEEKQLAGINRCMSILGLEKHPNDRISTTSQTVVDSGTWQDVADQINSLGVYLSKVDLEHDLQLELPREILAYSGKDNEADAVKYIQEKKAIRMREFIVNYSDSLSALNAGVLALPLIHAKNIVDRSF